MSIPTEKILVQQIVAGDQAAFRRFVDQYQNLVWHVVSSMVSQKYDREDLCQDIFVKIYTSLPGFRFDAKLSSWIFKISYRRCLNYLAKKRVSLYEDTNGVEQTLEDVKGDTFSPIEQLVQRELIDRVHGLLKRLAPVQRTLISMYHLEGFSYSEIAEATELPDGTIKSYLYRARQKLQKMAVAVGQEAY